LGVSFIGESSQNTDFDAVFGYMLPKLNNFFMEKEWGAVAAFHFFSLFIFSTYFSLKNLRSL